MAGDWRGGRQRADVRGASGSLRPLLQGPRRRHPCSRSLCTSPITWGDGQPLDTKAVRHAWVEHPMVDSGTRVRYCMTHYAAHAGGEATPQLGELSTVAARRGWRWQRRQPAVIPPRLNGRPAPLGTAASVRGAAACTAPRPPRGGSRLGLGGGGGAERPVGRVRVVAGGVFAAVGAWVVERPRAARLD